MKKLHTLILLTIMALPFATSASTLDDSFGVVFAMDASGSVQADGWEQEKQLVQDFIDTALSADTQVGIVRFDTYTEIVHNFNDDQDRAVINSTIDSMNFIGGRTSTRSALEDAIDIFTYATIDATNKVIILITDGNPYPYKEQNPCITTGEYLDQAAAVRDALTTNDITVVILGVGDTWDPSILECLVEDSDSDIIHAEDFSSDSLTLIRDRILDRDEDDVTDAEDNCPDLANANQADMDGDDIGDLCDDDRDGDGVDNEQDLYPDDDSRWEDQPEPTPAPAPPQVGSTNILFLLSLCVLLVTRRNKQ